ncbi:hypothetical protein BDA99DRAFT_559422 [Phascolomyces articulosus]|uniref:Uncharacterized protein n=1 Tax=Phascolomyces articulosus TaxID=60185 RepID=A0AAD5KAJ7_9FUNG|nr:hypothetical protein BDA99DRAFT_559422 [Phascolomyces articulosus]
MAPNTTATASVKKYKSWSKDAPGSQFTKSSIELLVKRLTEPGNYSKYTSNTNHRIVDSFNEANVFLFDTSSGVDEEDVTQTIERRSTTQDMVNEMYAKNESNEEIKVSIEDKVRSICKYYFELEPVMRDRPSIRPPAPMSSGDGEEEEASSVHTAPAPAPALATSPPFSLAIGPSGKRIELEERKANREERHAKIDVLKSLLNEGIITHDQFMERLDTLL